MIERIKESEQWSCSWAAATLREKVNEIIDLLNAEERVRGENIKCGIDFDPASWPEMEGLSHYCRCGKPLQVVALATTHDVLQPLKITLAPCSCQTPERCPDGQCIIGVKTAFIGDEAYETPMTESESKRMMFGKDRCWNFCPKCGRKLK